MARKEKYTFYQWCVDNDKNDLLERWDYEKTGFGPKDITYASAKQVYFKCENGLHESEIRRVFTLTSKTSDRKTFRCKQCSQGRSPRFQDLSGKKFGKITAICPDDDRNNNKADGNNQYYWKCICECGNKFSTYGAILKNGVQVTCGDRAIHRSGEDNSNWKGGITTENQRIRGSKDYINWRNSVLEINKKCVVCGSDVAIEIHHIYAFSKYIDKRFEKSNGVPMCYSHHSIKSKDSVHSVYGYTPSPKQLETYINDRRKKLGIDIPFNIEYYMIQMTWTQEQRKYNELAYNSWVYNNLLKKEDNYGKKQI